LTFVLPQGIELDALLLVSAYAATCLVFAVERVKKETLTRGLKLALLWPRAEGEVGLQWMLGLAKGSNALPSFV
jgi:hypothetical protein